MPIGSGIKYARTARLADAALFSTPRESQTGEGPKATRMSKTNVSPPRVTQRSLFIRIQCSVALVLISLFTIGCNKVERDLVTAYAWSDDDTRHVYARSQWKFTMAALPDGRTREEHNNARFTILAQSPDGSNRVTLVPWRGGGVNIIYDMRRAGYILARIDTGLYADNYEYTLFF